MFLFQPAPPAPAIAPAPPAETAPASAQPARFVRYGFDHAELGMSLAQWQASSPENAQAPCAPTAGDAHVVVCEPPPATGDVREQDRKAVFVDGVLAHLAFSTSIDSFNGVMAKLDQTFGKPAEIVRNTIRLGDGLVLPHVLMTWTNGLATIRIADPQPPGGLMSVRATLNADTERLRADRG